LVWWVYCIPGRAIWFTIPIFTIWFRGAAWILICILGARRARSTSCRFQRCPSCFGLASNIFCVKHPSLPRSPHESGTKNGWCIATKELLLRKAVGNGQAALKYLAPYVYRVAISNRRLTKLVDTGHMESSLVTFSIGLPRPASSNTARSLLKSSFTVSCNMSSPVAL
jgi:hypothetical protein